MQSKNVETRGTSLSLSYSPDILKPMTRLPVAFLLLSAAGVAQTPAFEVASIRPAGGSPGPPLFCPLVCFGVGLRIEGTRVDIASIPLDELLTKAYRIRPDQLSGPVWMRNQKFDILADIPEGVSPSQVPEMLQVLLMERFHLAAHRETREQPVYALTVDKRGPKLKEAESAIPHGDQTLMSPQGPIEAKETDDGLMVTRGPWGPMRLPYKTLDPSTVLTRSGENRPEIELLRVTMPLLADALTQFMDRPVIDRTNLKGAYRVAIFSQDIHAFVMAKVFAQDPEAASYAAFDPTGSSTIFKTMEKLGLKLERTKAPVEMLVVDRLEKSPTEN
jgi:uncharacterized protein (TIGR03435 family)